MLEAVSHENDDQQAPVEIDDPVVDYVSNHPAQSPSKKLKVSPRQEIFFCNFKESDPVDFWVSVLMKFDMSRDLEKLIKSTIIIPVGSADAERSFSQMNLIKSKLKSRSESIFYADE